MRAIAGPAAGMEPDRAADHGSREQEAEARQGNKEQAEADRARKHHSVRHLHQGRQGAEVEEGEGAVAEAVGVVSRWSAAGIALNFYTL